MERVLALQSRRENPNPDYMDSFQSACQLAAPYCEVVPYRYTGVVGNFLIDSAVHYMLNNRFTHLFLAADDLIYPGFIIPRLVRDNKDVVAGIYPKRQVKPIIPATHVEDPVLFNEYRKKKAVVEAKYLSAHTMMIKRHVFEKMHQDYPELRYVDHSSGNTYWYLFIDTVEDGKLLLGDWAFSLRARRSGFTLWLDYGVECGHQAPPSTVWFAKLEEK